MTETKLRAVLYARISRDIEGRGLGVERQLEDCRALAQARNFAVVRELTDNDVSAYSGRARPAYRELLELIDSGEVDVVVCWHTDRLHRSPLELEQYITISELRKVATLTVQAGELDLATSSGRMTARVHGAVARQESERKSERLARQKLQAASAGKYLGGRVPWGWKIQGGVEIPRGRLMPDGTTGVHGTIKGGTIVVDPEAATYIREGIQAILDGHSLVEVTRRWAAGGARSLSGTRMNTTQVRRVLTRARNAGIVTHKGETVSSDWPAIVTLDEFRAMQAKLEERDIPRQSAAKFKYLLSGIVRCHCGDYMTGFGAAPSPTRPTYRRMYRCRIHQAGGRYIPGHATREMHNLDEFVLQAVARYLRRPEVKGAVLTADAEVGRAASPKTDDTKELIARREELAGLFAEGAIERSQLVEGTARIRERLAEIEYAARRQGGNRQLVSTLMAKDPGGAFLAAETAVQRELVRSVVSVQVVEGAPHGTRFRPEFVRLDWTLQD